VLAAALKNNEIPEPAMKNFLWRLKRGLGE